MTFIENLTSKADAADGCYPAWLAWIVLCFALLFVLPIFAVFRRRKPNRVLEALAHQYQGTYGYSGMAVGDRVEFTLDQTIQSELTFYSAPSNGRIFTRLRFNSRSPGYLRVNPVGLFTSLRRMFHAKEVKVADSQFSKIFQVEGSPEQWVRDVLDADVRRRLTLLRELGVLWGWGKYRVTLDVGPSGTVVTFGRDLVWNSDELQRFVEDAIFVFRRIHEPRSTPLGIEILSINQIVSRGECPVCASALDDGLHICESCGTPHHRDCWEYFCGCAIYGCGRKKQPASRTSS